MSSLFTAFSAAKVAPDSKHLYVDFGDSLISLNQVHYLNPIQHAYLCIFLTLQNSELFTQQQHLFGVDTNKKSHPFTWP